MDLTNILLRFFRYYTDFKKHFTVDSTNFLFWGSTQGTTLLLVESSRVLTDAVDFWGFGVLHVEIFKKRDVSPFPLFFLSSITLMRHHLYHHHHDISELSRLYR